MTFLTKAFVSSSLQELTVEINTFLATMPAKTAINVTLTTNLNGAMYAILLYSQ